jgi:excisionase family DNA binding protein
MPGKSNKIQFHHAEVVSISEAAARLGVSHKTIRRMIADGRLPAFRVGGGPIRTYADDVEALKIPVRMAN